MDTIVSNFPLVVDHLFVSNHFGKEARENVAQMVEDLRAAMSDIIAGEKWMQRSTKTNAIRKLKKTKKVIAAVQDAIDVKRLDERYETVKFDFPRDSYRQMATKGLEKCNFIYFRQFLVVLNNARRLFMNVVKPELYTFVEVTLK